MTANKAYLVTVNDVYVTDIKQDGTFGELKRIVDDLPDAGQHNDRTIAVGPDGMLYVSVGSTCNACAEPNPENATMLQMKPDGSARKIFASGLRNTIGFAFDPATGKLWGADHGIDWLGDDEQPEEINLIEQGKQYGWPYIYGNGGKNPQDNPPPGISLDDWAKASETPVLTYTAHAAPMQLAFYNGSQFPAAFNGDAFLAMHGSWNRKPPSGYEVVRVRFEDGKPAKIEPFITGFLTETDGAYGYVGRPFGVAVAKDGSLFIGDDANGIIYRVTYETETAAETSPPREAKPAKNAAVKEQDTPRDLAANILEGDGKLEVKSPAFEDNGRLPARYSAYEHDFSPELSWSMGPDGTKSYVVLMEDIDVPDPKPFVHWILFNIPADVTQLDEGVPGTAALEKPEKGDAGHELARVARLFRAEASGRRRSPLPLPGVRARHDAQAQARRQPQRGARRHAGARPCQRRSRGRVPQAKYRRWRLAPPALVLDQAAAVLPRRLLFAVSPSGGERASRYRRSVFGFRVWHGEAQCRTLTLSRTGPQPRNPARASRRPVLGEKGSRRLVDPQGRIRGRRRSTGRREARIRGGARQRRRLHGEVHRAWRDRAAEPQSRHGLCG